jgi:putative FmdB family regulatory protein
VLPTYEYECQACGHEFERFQSMKDDPVKRCPECRRLKVKRLFGTGAGIIFKGSGFYETDYRSKSYHQDASKDKTASKASTSTPASTKKDEKAKKAE